MPRLNPKASLHGISQKDKLEELIYSSRDMHTDIKEIKDNVTQITGRLAVLESTTSFAKGVAAVLVVLIPFVIYILTHLVG
jgi:hypothetical protein